MSSQDGQDFVLVHEDDLTDYNEAGILPQTPEIIDGIRRWLEPTDYLAESSEYKKHLSSHVAGTGGWIQQTDSYRMWHESPTCGSLWVKATAGAGKSVFAAITAKKLLSTEKAPVLFFFFRQIVATNHDPQSLTRDWISMILNHSPPLQAKMKKYMDERRALHTISTNQFWQDLEEGILALPKVYCIVDALDEMDIDQERFLENLVRLGKSKPVSIKIMLTSRPLPRIEAFLKDPSVLQIRLEQLKVDEDIAVYVDFRLQQASVDLELRPAVRKAIGERAQGSFLYARLMMDELLDHLKQMIPDVTYIQRSLTWLPLTLEDMYNGMLWDHSLRSNIPQNLQVTILSWVTHSSRPLRLLELATMIDSQSGKTGSDTKAAVRAACGPLLEILEDETVSVIHHSFTEFLIDAGRISRTAIADTHPQFPVIDPMATHGSLALTCLRYLSSGCLKGLILSDRPREGINHRSAVQNAQELKLKYSFLEYAMHNFYIHARKCGADDLLVSQLDAFMTNNEQAFHAWLNLCWPGQSKSSLLSPLHAAAMAGMANYVQHLLQSGADGNARDGEQKTPLSWASAKGHADVVAVLLANVEDPDVDDEQGLKPLHYAAQGNHYQVVRLLLKAGVSPLTGKTKDYGRRCGNSPSSIGHNPLKYASEAGSVESIREMVPYLEPKDLNNALVWATKEGKALVVELLLTLPDCSPDPPGQPNSPLFLAAAGLHFDIMRALLSSGAIPDKLSDNPDSGMRFLNIEDMLEQAKSGSTPLHALCGGSKQRFRRSNDENAEKCFGLLLQAGCNLDAR